MAENLNNIDDLFKEAFDNFDQKPKADIWDKISGQVAFDAQINQAFGSFEVDPGANVWLNIDQQFSFDEQIRNSLGSFEVQPQAAVWEAVASHPLEAKMRNVLSHYEVEPDDSNWEKIKKRIPLTLFMGQYREAFLRVAAILIVGLLLSLGLQVSLMETSGFVAEKETPTSNHNASLLAEAALIFEKIAKTPTVETTVLADNEATNNTQVVKNNTQKAVYQVESIAQILENEVVEAALVASSVIVPPAVNTAKASSTSSHPKTSISPITQTIKKQELVFVNEIPSKENFIPQAPIEIKLAKQKNKIQDSHSSPSILANVTTAFADEEIEELEKLEEIISNNKLVSRTDNPKTIETLNYRGLYLLSSGQYGFNWLYNEPVREQLSEIVDAGYTLSLGGSAGFGFGFLITPRLSLEAQWNYSRVNQSYRELFPGGLMSDSQTKLTYSSFPVLLKVQLNRLKNNRRVPMTTSVAFGGQYRYLRNSLVQANIELTRSQFVENEIGLVLGYDVNLHLSKKIFVTIGGRASVGTDADMLANLSKDGRFNSELGLRMAVNYKLN